MLALIALIAVSQTATPPAFQGKLKPDPTNAYFDYVQAGEELNKGEFRTYEYAIRQPAMIRKDVEARRAAGTPPSDVPAIRDRHKLEEELAGLKPLEVRRKAAQRFRKVITLLESARRKEARDPRRGAKYDMEEVFPELANFRFVSGFATMMADLNYAEGRPIAAGEHLMDSLRLATATQKTPLLIHCFVGRAFFPMTVGCIERNLRNMSLPEATRIHEWVNDRLAEPSPFTVAMAFEGPTSIEMADSYFTLEAEDLSEGLEAIATLSPEAKRRVIAAAKSIAGNRLRAALAVLAKGERASAEFLNTLPPDEPEDKNRSLEEKLADELLFTPAQVVELALLERVQLRLLRATMAIVEHRWMHDRYPDRLEQLGAPELILDPVRDQPMKYRLEGSNFDLSATGSDRLGEVRLQYRFPRDSEPPPP